MTRNRLILILIVLLAFALRFWWVASLPPGLTWDEAALGYNAYSILKTGRGEHGHLLPIVFTSFGDYKPGLYIYADVPFVALFGLNETSVRLVSVLAGTLTVLLMYFFAETLFGKDREKHKLSIGLWPAFVLAINPWHIHFSRGAWEVNLFVFILLASLLLLIKSFQKRWLIVPSIVLALLTLDTYQAAKMLTPLLWFTTLVIYWPQSLRLLKRLKRHYFEIAAIVIVIALTVGLLYLNLTGPAGNRLNRLSLFNYNPEYTQTDKKIDSQNPLTLSLFHSQFNLYYHAVASRYLYHFSPEVLFYEGSVISDRGHIPHMGMLYMVDAFWILIGLAALMKLRNSRIQKFVFSLLLLAPVPAALTLSEFSTTRALFMVIPLTLIIGLGLERVIRKWPIWLLIPILGLYLANVVYGMDLYFFHSARGIAAEYNYGYKQAIEDIVKYPAKDIVFTDVYGQPYIYYLFYTQFDPATYQAHNDFTDEGVDVGRVGRVGNVEFHQFSYQEIFNRPDTLFIGSIGNIPDNFNYQDPKVEFYDEIRAPDDRVVFRVVKSK